MEVLYNFKKYDTPKFGIFNITTDEYTSKGWGLKQEEYKIIGEDNDTFVYRLLESGHGEWVGDKVIQRKYILPIGIHKSRLVQWTSGQLSLFD